MDHEQFIDFYNYLACLVTRRTGRRVKLLKRSQHKESVEKLLDKIKADFPLNAYLISCFAYHSWSYYPLVDRLHLSHYRSYFFDNQAEVWAWCSHIIREYASQIPVEVPVGKEILKKQYAAMKRPDLCMERRALTGGYNSKSDVCLNCKLRGNCGFSV